MVTVNACNIRIYVDYLLEFACRMHGVLHKAVYLVIENKSLIW